MAAVSKTDSYYTVNEVTKLSSEDGNKIRKLLNEVEKRTANWIEKDEWKHHKTVENRADLKKDIGKLNQISVYNYTDNNFYPKMSIWKVEAFVPETDSNKIFGYYNVPKLRTQFDKASISTFYEIPLNLCFVK